MNTSPFLTCGRGLLRTFTAPCTTRNVHQIPHYENHIRFSPIDGRKRPAQDVLDRFKRLNNGMWIKAIPGRHKQRYMKDEVWNEISEDFETCTKEECEMLDKMMSPFWLRKVHYPNDPFRAYHVRHGLNTPRVDHKKRFIRERTKVLLDDTTSLKYMCDR
ncbi:unnamed protein product [Bursaphelenchus okinawaensis]|uniref:39S ribosomal protein L35, mitochondrial n=1 Tax=Bursaphelenchus okinawaensis TaxID=465554 RepID=A0A811KIL4_9BILA|nr:unnamed protein product [Bursaphelenchus okinawaensis]CAG9103907.1 unnamed protein product [Bursaphelenchus okinawaensis]